MHLLLPAENLSISQTMIFSKKVPSQKAILILRPKQHIYLPCFQLLDPGRFATAKSRSFKTKSITFYVNHEDYTIREIFIQISFINRNISKPEPLYPNNTSL